MKSSPLKICPWFRVGGRGHDAVRYQVERRRHLPPLGCRHLSWSYASRSTIWLFDPAKVLGLEDR